MGELGAERVVAIGNGANDAMMLRQAALGTLALAGSARVAVLGGEGLSAACFAARDIESTLDLLALSTPVGRHVADAGYWRRSLKGIDVRTN